MVLCNEFRHPVQLAKEAVTLDVASGGRLELGIGAGWYEREFRSAGLPFPRAGVRLQRLGEAVRILRAAFSGEPFSFAGEHYAVEDMLVRPRPAPAPAIWVGGKGDRAMRLIGRSARDGTPRGSRTPWLRERARLFGDAPVRRSIGQYAQGSSQEMVDRLARSPNWTSSTR